jgi:hypothetical protein
MASYIVILVLVIAMASLIHVTNVTTALTSDVVRFKNPLSTKFTNTSSITLSLLSKTAMLVMGGISAEVVIGPTMVCLYALNAALPWVLNVQHSPSKPSTNITHISFPLLTLLLKTTILKNIIV